MSRIVLESLRKIYAPDVRAVDDLDLDVADGELLVIVGPSGCGKTTVLRLIAGLETPTAGAIRFDDEVVNGQPPERRDVAMVFQDYALYPHMTVRQNLAFGLRMRKTPRAEIERRITRTVDLLGIADLLDRRPAALSGGERQRAAVGRALVREPRCCLLDEPLSNLDASLRLQMRVELKRLHRRLPTTTIHVTHDQEEAMTLGGRLAVMARGAIQQVGAPLDVYRSPANRFVAGFLGSPPMNFFEGRVESRDGAPVFTDGDGVEMPLEAVAASAAADGRVVGGEGEPIVLGVRPEHLAPEREGGGRRVDGRLRVIVDAVEPLGDRIDVQASTPDGVRVVARLDTVEASCEAGARMTFRIDPRRAHFFAAGASGERL